MVYSYLLHIFTVHFDSVNYLINGWSLHADIISISCFKKLFNNLHDKSLIGLSIYHNNIFKRNKNSQ